MSRLGFRPLIYNLNSKAKDPDRELDNHATDMKLLVEIHLRVECMWSLAFSNEKVLCSVSFQSSSLQGQVVMDVSCTACK